MAFGSLDGSDWQDEEARANLAAIEAAKKKPSASWMDVIKAPNRIIGGLAATPVENADAGAMMPETTVNPIAKGLMDALGGTIKSGVTAPGDVASGKLPMTDAEGHTNPVAIERAFDTASLAGGASAAGNLGRDAATAGTDLRVLGKQVLASDSGKAGGAVAAASRAADEFVPMHAPREIKPKPTVQPGIAPEVGQAGPEWAKLTPDQQWMVHDMWQDSAKARDYSHPSEYYNHLIKHTPEDYPSVFPEGAENVGQGAPARSDVAGGAGGGDAGLAEAAAAAARRAGAGHQPLEGLPTAALKIGNEHYVPGPIGSIRDVAGQYMMSRNPTEHGQPFPTQYHKLDKERSMAIAKAFDEMKHESENPAVKASYDAMIKETGAQFDHLMKSGVKIEPIRPDMADPYAANPRLAAKDVGDNNHLWFFPTEQGFGTTAQGGIDLSTHPMMQPSGRTLNGKPLLNNDLFRVVHDYFGHLKEGYGFRAEGEDNAWRSHAAMYSDLARPAMTTETRGQNSWVNYGPHGETNRKASAADTKYADQKVGLLPDWVMSESYPGQRKYPIADRGEWHGDANYEHTGGRMQMMTPDEYLAQARPMAHDELTKENVADLRKHVEQGGTLDPLALYANGKEDGRHRALMAKELGISEVPVLNFRGKKLAEDSAPGATISTGKRIIDERGLPVAGKDYTKEAQRVQREITSEGKGVGPLDLSSATEVPHVEQRPLDRYVPPRGISPRMQDALANPAVRQGLEESMQAGSGVANWYHTEPIRRAFVDELGEAKGAAEFKRFMDTVAATSPRSDVPTNIRNASYYYAGGDPEKANPYPYGHVAQALHKQNVMGLQERGGWDVMQNPKPASFAENLRGNLEPVTVDTHAFRNIGMRTGDPRFLETSFTQKRNPGAAPDTMQSRFGEEKVDKNGNTIVTFRPQQLVKDKRVTMKEAQDIPAFWTSKPKDNEYAAAEQLFRQVGNKAGLRPADAQAAAWAGAGEMTGLGTVGTHTFPELMNERIEFTARMRNESPKKVLQDFIRGKKPLLSDTSPGAFGSLDGRDHRDDADHEYR